MKIRNLPVLTTTILLILCLTTGLDAQRRRGQRPGNRLGDTFRVRVIPDGDTLRFRCRNDTDCSTIQVNASNDRRYNRIRWDFNFRGESIVEASISFAGKTPCFEAPGNGNARRDRRRAVNNGRILMRLKTLDWAEDDVTEITDGEEFKYDVTVTTERNGVRKEYKVDPIVIVRRG